MSAHITTNQLTLLLPSPSVFKLKHHVYHLDAALTSCPKWKWFLPVNMKSKCHCVRAYVSSDPLPVFDITAVNQRRVGLLFQSQRWFFTHPRVFSQSDKRLMNSTWKLKRLKDSRKKRRSHLPSSAVDILWLDNLFIYIFDMIIWLTGLLICFFFFFRHIMVGLHWVQSIIRKWWPELSKNEKRLQDSCSEDR